MLLERDRCQLLMVDVQERLLPAMSDPTLVLKQRRPSCWKRPEP